ncbi:MAG: VWA domain-containing protein [Planctomycetes bacterium]|nr:VWA domain-containing protein [Planctomycetota bacterium]
MFDELLFSLGSRAWRRVFGGEDAALLERSVGLCEVVDRLRVLAWALGERPYALNETEGLGGVRGDAIYLPKQCSLAPTAEQNVQAYVLRLACGLELQRSVRLSAALDEAERRVATLLVWPRLEAQLLERLPGASEPWRALLALCGEGEPEPARARERVLWRWARALARGEEPGEPVVCEALSRLRAEGLSPAARWLAKELKRLKGTRGAAPPRLLWLSGVLQNPMRGESAPAGGEEFQTQPDALPSGTERQGQSKEEVEVLADETEKQHENPVLHLFEKTETAEEYQGTRKQLDGSDDMAEQGEALDELDLRQVIRSNRPTASLYRADLVLEHSGGEVEDGTRARRAIYYDEWDERRRAYRPRHCALFSEVPEVGLEPARVAEHVNELRHRLRHQIRELRSAFSAISQERALRSRQRDGSDLDLDALVDAHAQRRAGRTPDDRLWIARRRRDHELAVLVLIDVSLSADAWVSGRRVLEVERQAVFTIGEALGAGLVTLEIGAFFSHTRRDCRYVQVKGFKAPWRACLPGLFSLQPQGYTRIGPALRHATRLLQHQKAKRKLLILLSDGKATDLDRYEGRHGTADVRQAVREARSLQITPFALAIEAEAKVYLPQLFGRSGFEILTRPEHLPQRLGYALERVLR